MIVVRVHPVTEHRVVVSVTSTVDGVEGLAVTERLTDFPEARAAVLRWLDEVEALLTPSRRLRD